MPEFFPVACPQRQGAEPCTHSTVVGEAALALRVGVRGQARLAARCVGPLTPDPQLHIVAKEVLLLPHSSAQPRLELMRTDFHQLCQGQLPLLACVCGVHGGERCMLGSLGPLLPGTVPAVPTGYRDPGNAPCSWDNPDKHQLLPSVWVPSLPACLGL